MKMFASILVIGLLSALVTSQHVPDTNPMKLTTCEQFEQGARFNPYEILDSVWKIFYFWGNTTEIYPILFSLPTKKRLDKIRLQFEAVDPSIEVEWHKATLLMEPRPDLLVIFLYELTPGAFRAIVRKTRRSEVQPHPLPRFKFSDVRLKQMGTFIVMMCCEDLTAFALARVHHMPTTEQDCEKTVSHFDIKLPHPHSYLYIKRIIDEL